MRLAIFVLVTAGAVTAAFAQADREAAILEREAQFFVTPSPRPTHSPTPRPTQSPTPTPVPTPGADADVDAAQALLAAGEVEQARARLQVAIAKEPGNARVQDFAARLGQTRQDIASADRTLEKEDTDRAVSIFGWLSFFSGPIQRLDLTWTIGLILVTLVAIVAIRSWRR